MLAGTTALQRREIALHLYEDYGPSACIIYVASTRSSFGMSAINA